LSRFAPGGTKITIPCRARVTNAREAFFRYCRRSCDAPPAFLPARPITHVRLAALTERGRRRVIRWFRMQRLLDAAAAADMLAWENSGFSVDASVRITLTDRDVPSYFQSLEHLLRYCARPPFALE